MMIRARTVAAILGLSCLVFAEKAWTDNPASDFDADGAQDESRSVPGIQAVVAPSAVGRIAIDRSHGGYLPERGFLSYLVDNGWQVTTILSGPVTVELLDQYDILMLAPSYNTYTEDEIAAVQLFMAGGHGLWAFNDIYDSATGTNSLCSRFGVIFNAYDYVYDATNNQGMSSWPNIHVLETHPVTQGVADYGFYAGTSLTAQAPARVIAWGDGDAHSQMYRSAPPVLAVYEAAGRAVFSGDTTPLYWDYFPSRLDVGDIQLLNNIVGWLLESGAVGVESRSWSDLKNQYR